jgi:peptidoglycan/LPS O-acetylase OafA/YrhL
VTNNAKTLAFTLTRGNNNFDLIRLIAALSVMYGHSFGVHGGAGPERVLAFTWRESSGSLAVFAFFLISGMLVTASYIQQGSVLRFIAARALRIWPGAIVCALFIGLIIGPAFNSNSVVDYFANSTTQRWLLHNITLMGGVQGLDAMLPGVFIHNHLPLIVSATVWSLPVELECYVIVLVLGLLGIFSSRIATTVAVGLLGAAFAYFVAQPWAHAALAGFFIKPPAYSFYPAPYFFLGILLYTYRDRVMLHWLPAIGLAVLYLLNRHNQVGAWLLYPSFAYIVLWLASLPQLHALRPKYDYSYGVYLYGFVVQQAVTALFPTWSNYENLALAIPVAVILAALSWHFIEEPSLSMIRRPRQVFPLAQPELK